MSGTAAGAAHTKVSTLATVPMCGHLRQASAIGSARAGGMPACCKAADSGRAAHRLRGIEMCWRFCAAYGAPVGHPGALSRVLLFQQHRRHAQTFYLTIISADYCLNKAQSCVCVNSYRLEIPACLLHDAPMGCRASARAPSPQPPAGQRKTWLDERCAIGSPQPSLTIGAFVIFV